MSEMSIGRKCALIAKTKNLNQAKLAEEIGISRISINRFFNDHTNMRINEFTTLMKALGLDIEEEIDRMLMSASQTLAEGSTEPRHEVLP
jgi:transcriptional regulator with XRE-family HTH domain